MSVEDGIISLRKTLETRLDDVLKIIEINETVINIAKSELSSIGTQLDLMQRGGGISKAISNKIQSLSNIANNPTVVAQKSIITEQVIVLLIGALESYLGDVIKIIGNEQSDLFTFKEGEKISFSQSMLKGGFSLGDAILEHILNKKFSLQDLKSSLDLFDECLAIHIEFTDAQKDTLVLAAATRHVIVHRSSKVDRQFLKQVRDTAFATMFNLDDNVMVDTEIIEASKDALLSYADQITAAVLSKV